MRQLTLAAAFLWVDDPEGCFRPLSDLRYHVTPLQPALDRALLIDVRLLASSMAVEAHSARGSAPAPLAAPPIRTTPRPISPKSGTWLAAAAIGLLTTTTPIENVRDGDEGLSLAELAGSYAGRQGGFLSLCISAPGQSAPCADPSSVVRQFNDAEVLQGTFAPDGQFCLTDTDVFSIVGGSKDPAGIIDFIAKGSIISYDRKTGRGTTSFTLYIHTDDNGVGCNGAKLVNHKEVQPDSHGTQAFTVGQEPALHFDAVITSLEAVAGNYGGFVVGGTLYIQHQ
jgi:hypothetical protein